MAVVEELLIQLSRFIHSCIGQASTWSLRFRFSSFRLWQRKGKISGCLKNSTSFVVQQCQNKVSFQRKDSSIVIKFSPDFQKVESALLGIENAANPIRNSEKFTTTPKPFLWKLS